MIELKVSVACLWLILQVCTISVEDQPIQFLLFVIDVLFWSFIFS